MSIDTHYAVINGERVDITKSLWAGIVTIGPRTFYVRLDDECYYFNDPKEAEKFYESRTDVRKEIGAS